MSKHKAKAPQRRVINRRNKIVRFLIVCEGEKTEPNYFKALIKDHYSDVLDVSIQGKGLSTSNLIKEALKKKDEFERKRQLPYDRVWVVFDKDEFKDFNEAIALAKREKIGCAWSNESFELWYYLHFQYLDTGIKRDDYIKKLENECRKKKGYESFSYTKNDPQIYNLLNEIAKEELAKKNAKKLREKFRGNKNYNSHNPRTEVDLLVDELENPTSVLEK